jgi:hypothetical protein
MESLAMKPLFSFRNVLCILVDQRRKELAASSIMVGFDTCPKPQEEKGQAICTHTPHYVLTFRKESQVRAGKLLIGFQNGRAQLFTSYDRLKLIYEKEKIHEGIAKTISTKMFIGSSLVHRIVGPTLFKLSEQKISILFQHELHIVGLLHFRVSKKEEYLILSLFEMIKMIQFINHATVFGGIATAPITPICPFSSIPTSTIGLSKGSANKEKKNRNDPDIPHQDKSTPSDQIRIKLVNVISQNHIDKQFQESGTHDRT